jgi:ribosome-binding protein aMBF1 (putative translation factor)
VTDRASDTERLDRAAALLVAFSSLEREIDAFLEIERAFAVLQAPAKKRAQKRRSRNDGPKGREIGQRIRAARCGRGMTQLELSTATGIRRPNIARLERGGNTPTIETLQRIARALNVDAVSLIADLSPADRSPAPLPQGEG